MKKLIVLAAAATMAVCAQAATISWALTSKDTFKLQNGDSAKGIDVYILNTAGSDYSTLISGIADGSKKAADVSGSASFVATAKTGTSNAQAGKIGSTTSFNESTVTGAGKGETYSLAFLVFDSAGEDSYYYLSSTQSATNGPCPTKFRPSASSTIRPFVSPPSIRPFVFPPSIRPFVFP